MPPFRVVVLTDQAKSATTVIAELDRSPDVGETSNCLMGSASSSATSSAATKT